MSKKHILTAVVALAFVFTAGVFARDIVKIVKSEIREEFAEKKLLTTSGKTENEAVVNNGDGEANQNEQKVEYIDEEKAKEIALDKAGLKENEVSFIKVELDWDNGILRYEVEFRQGFKEYSAEIKADDGKILDWEIDIDD